MGKGRINTALYFRPVVLCTKTLMMLFNFVFWVTGIVILAIGVWTTVDLYKYLTLSSSYQPEVPYVLIGVGAFIILIGCLGCCCTIKGHSLLLYTFAGFLFLIFVTELSIGIALLAYRDKIEEGFENGLANALKKYDEKSGKEINDAFDKLQRTLECCGIDNYTDWFDTPYSRKQNGPSVPESCCRVSLKECHHTDLKKTSINIKYLYTQGCQELVVDFLDENISTVGGIALGISFFQILGTLMAVCVAKSVSTPEYEEIA